MDLATSKQFSIIFLENDTVECLKEILYSMIITFYATKNIMTVRWKQIISLNMKSTEFWHMTEM